jgi:hypothetical protein
MALEIVEMVMAFEEALGLGADEIDGETTLGDVHWIAIQRGRQAQPPRRSADEIWSDLVRTLEEFGVPPSQIKPETRIVDLIV